MTYVKNNRLRVLSALIILLLLVCASMIACGDNTNSEHPATETETLITSETPDIPIKNFDGKEFIVMVKQQVNWSSYEIYSEGLTGDLINDAVYNRNAFIEERYNINISEVTTECGNNGGFVMHRTIANLIMAGDDTYDIIMPTLQDGAALGRDKYVYELTDMPYLDINNEWWNSVIITDTSVLGKTYFVSGDLTMLTSDASYIIMFNKKHVRDYGLDDYYNAVNKGTWTIDMLLKDASTYSDDINSDGVVDDTDNVGFMLTDGVINALFYGCGGRVTSLDNQFTLQLELDKEHNLNVLTALSQLYSDKEAVLNTYDSTRTSNKFKEGTNVLADSTNVFAGGSVLFYSGTLSNIPRLRNMDTDFGILPMPKFSDSQENYHTSVNPWAASTLVIPITAEDVEYSAIISEALGYYSYLDVTPEYYERSLKGRFIRDNESEDMLNIILGNIMMDLGAVYHIGSYYNNITTTIKKYENNFSSLIAQTADIANTQVAELNSLFAN